MEHRRAPVGGESGHTGIASATPPEPFVRILPVSAAVVLYLAALNYVYENKPWWEHLPGFLLLLITLTASLWIGERLWRTSAASLFSFRKQILIFLSKLPFWAAAGGIGWEMGLLLAKRYALLTIYDIPIRPWFVFGCVVGILIQGFVFIFVDRLMATEGRRQAASASDHHKEQDHDENRTT